MWFGTRLTAKLAPITGGRMAGQTKKRRQKGIKPFVFTFDIVQDCRSGTSHAIPKAGKAVRTGAASASKAGSIYLLVHASGRMVKIGRTKVSGEARRAAYVRSHKLNGEWSLRGEWPVSDAASAERDIHKGLKELRFSSKAREVFACSENEALGVIRRSV